MNDNRTTIITIASALVLAVGLGVFVALGSSKEEAVSGDVVSQTGIHAHPRVTITIKGQPQVIPAEVGAAAHKVHTHDASGEIHWELQGVVRQDDMKLGKLFEAWGQPFNSSSILSAKNGPEGSVKMNVNGTPNTEFENYQIKDKDQIEIRFE